jgi:HEXXH motif-containing protein
MKETERAYRGFANPFEPLDDDFLEAVCVLHARELVGRFLDRFREKLRERAEGLDSALERWLAAEATFDDVWDPAFGRLRLCLEGRESPDVVGSAAAAALRIAERGGGADWEARLPSATRLRIGQLLLPPGDRLGVSADKRRIALRVSRGRRTRTWTLPRRSDDGAVNAGGLDTLSSTDAEGVRIVILREEVLGADPTVEAVPLDGAPDSIVLPLNAAIHLIASHSAPYLSWIRRVVRQILPLRDDPSMMRSSTAAWRSGLVYSANRPDPATLAEILVHEGSHQYLFILNRLGPLDDGSDPNLYYSPVNRTMRPLGMVVVAYHALANITLFCRECPSGSALRPRQIEKTFLEAINAYEDILCRSRSLTAVGTALWRPLYERLHDGREDRLSAARSPDTARKVASGSYRSTTARRRKERRTSYPASPPRDRAGRTTSRAPSAR